MDNPHNRMDNPHNLRRRLALTVLQPLLLLPHLLATRTVVHTVCHHSPLPDHPLEQPLQNRIHTVVPWFPPVLLRQQTIRSVGTGCHLQHLHNLQQRLPTLMVLHPLCCRSQNPSNSCSKHPIRMAICTVRLLHSRHRLQQTLDSELWCLLNSPHRRTLEHHHRSNSNNHPCLQLILSRSSTLHQRLLPNLLLRHRHRRHLHRMPWSQQLLLPRVAAAMVTFGAILDLMPHRLRKEFLLSSVAVVETSRRRRRKVVTCHPAVNSTMLVSSPLRWVSCSSNHKS